MIILSLNWRFPDFVKVQLKDKATLGNQLAGWLEGTATTEAVRDVVFAMTMPALGGVCAAQRLSALRLAGMELAYSLTAYRLDHGEFPKNLESLVPEYIERIPIDPFSGKPIAYKLRSDDCLIFSYGLDQLDNGESLRNEGDQEGRSYGDDLVIRLTKQRESTNTSQEPN